MKNLKTIILSTVFTLSATAAFAEPYRIGVLTDMSGMNFDLAGQGSVVAAQMAVEDFGGKLLGETVEVIVGDHQNKPDVGSTLARTWIDSQNVVAVVDVPTSSVAMAVQEITRQTDTAFLISTAGSSALTGEACSPSTAQWTWDTFAMANGTGRAMTLEGAKKWYFITVDYTFGHALEADTTQAVLAAGGEVVGSVRHPRETTDFSSYILQAQASGADVIALANSSGDTMTALKQMQEYGITEAGQKIAGMLLFLTDVQGVGLDIARGLTLTTAFYWDMDDQTREWSARYSERMDGKKPTMVHAGVYSAVTNYLKAAEKAGEARSGSKVMETMRGMDINDFFNRNAYLREDGRVIHDMFLVRVKAPEDSGAAGDLYEVLATIPGKEAFASVENSACPLVKK
ncbi:ABC transporter substrate-binding protein [Aquamicrobium defluvii]|uniref:ABC transporter permease n=1 Tax=Aquamicrobium defluvii TaxID=69279 RepID=A0A011T5J3_9HYPH|nr:ABC transporter substrate-binding protein [Aquamicrobium defluvii]EXL06829.1 ABC transporter permease [Aquamicrobium defluvii]EZQ15734.1 ABC transporter permease [Halopseudomonas bauzanensis]TDR35856.1 amino acid/amide ABC transporter substrate-binding protein (HAAT family) [Aquamicrobium defluvii]